MKIDMFACIMCAIVYCLVVLVTTFALLVWDTRNEPTYIEIEKPCPNEIPSDKLPWWLDPERKVEC